MALTIYERNGGFSSVRKVVSAFYDLALDSQVIGHHFEDIEMPRLIDHQTRFVSFLMGGPASYSDDHLERVHARLGITHAEFEEMVELLVETLEDHDFTSDDVAAIEKELRKRKPVIVDGR
ncbi:MAG: group 1 truncated hemoglobin [Thermoleophilaceae bacterium]